MTNQRYRPWASLVLLTAMAGCLDQTPVSSDERLIPVEAATFEVFLPFEEFVGDFKLCCSPRIGGFRGFGNTALLEDVVIAGEWGGDLNVNTLLRFPAPPKELEIYLEGFDTPVYDSIYTLDHGEVVLKLNPLLYEGEPPFTITVSELLSDWHVATATWDFAVDTVGAQVPWGEPGGGPRRELGTILWDPNLDPDTVAFQVDAETIERWSDVTRADRGVVVSIEGPNSRVVITESWLVLWVEASVEPGVLNSSKVTGPQVTQIYDPNPELDPEWIQIGGAPSRRAAFEIELPETITPPAEVCEIVSCPIQLEAENIVFGALRLYSRSTEPVGLQPLAPVRLELRTLLAPERFPRSPLGFDTGSLSAELSEFLFISDTERPADFPMTPFLRNLLRDPVEDGVPPPPTTLTLRSDPEPFGLALASFWGPGTEWAPQLRLVLTVSTEVPIP